MNIELLKPYGDFAVGDVIDIDETIGQHLIDQGIAQAFEAQKEVADEAEEKEEDEVEDNEDEKAAVSKRVKQIEAKLVKSATKSIEQIAKSFHKTNYVAEPKDKFNGISGINEMFRMIKAAKDGNTYCRTKLKPFEVNPSAEAKNWAEGAKLAGIKAPAGHSFGTPADGGYAVPEEWSAKLSSKPMNIPDLVGMTSGESISGNYLHLPGFQSNTETASGDLAIDGIQGGYAGEGVAFTPKKATFGDKYLLLKKLYVYIPFTNELLADASYDVSTRVQEKGLNWINRKKNEMFVSGAGTTQPTGCLNYNALITIAKESGQAAKTFNFENSKKMYQAMYPECINNAVWLINPFLWAQLVGMTFTAAGTTSAFGALTYNAHDEFALRLFGRPVISTLACSTPGLVGDVLFVDPTQIKSIKKELVVAVSSDIGFGSDETYFRLTDRHDWDIDTCWADKLSPRNGGTNYFSPVIALESRGS